MRISDWSSDVCSSDLITQGLGAGSRPEIGRAAAEETIDDVTKMLEGAHMCFIAAGMCGGRATMRARSDERCVGKECVSTCRSRWSPYHSKKNITNHMEHT